MHLASSRKGTLNGVAASINNYVRSYSASLLYQYIVQFYVLGGGTII